jgi:hypothetical protein
MSVPQHIREYAESMLFRTGWTEHSSSSQCIDPNKCTCLSSGTCVYTRLFHFMMIDDTNCLEPYDFIPGSGSIHMARENPNDENVDIHSSMETTFNAGFPDVLEIATKLHTSEEIVPNSNTLGMMFGYIKHILTTTVNTTLLCFFDGEYRSTFLHVPIEIEYKSVYAAIETNDEKIIYRCPVANTALVLTDMSYARIVSFVMAVTLTKTGLTVNTNDGNIEFNLDASHSRNIDINMTNREYIPMQVMPASCTLFVSIRYLMTYDEGQSIRHLTIHIVEVASPAGSSEAMPRVQGSFIYDLSKCMS